MLKNYREFLYEAGLDLTAPPGGEEKKEEAPDPEKEIEKKKEKKRKEAAKERNEDLDKAEESIKNALAKTPQDFRKQFEERIQAAIDADDRVKYHDLILDIQRFLIPKEKEQLVDEIESISPIVKTLQTLNKNEYKG